MKEIENRIAAGLERAFAARGFAAPSVEDLREAADVSLRTLYKYAPSRDAMVLMALEHRHRRYLEQLFGTNPTAARVQPLSETLDRIAGWMRGEASHGCLFHAAVAAAPGDPALRQLLETHKAEVARLAVAHAGQDLDTGDVLLIIEGMTQSWALAGDKALRSAKHLARLAEHNSAP